MAIQNSQGQTLVVGKQSFGRPTPNILRVIFRTILYLSAVWAIFIAPNINIPNHIELEIDKWLLVGNGIINHAIKYFSWDFKPND